MAAISKMRWLCIVGFLSDPVVKLVYQNEDAETIGSMLINTLYLSELLKGHS